MKNLFAATILILAFCAASFGQKNQTALCPNITILGPAEVIMPGETIVFTVTVNNEISENYLYKWTVTGGDIAEDRNKEEISSGESFKKGKTAIKTFQSPEAAGRSLTATVEVKGLPEGCPNTSSESMSILCALPIFTLIDEFPTSANQIDEAKLNNLAEKLQKNPSAQIYIIERFEKKNLPKTIERKNQKTIDYLKETGMDVSRFTFISGYSDKNLTQIFFVPSGATPPNCDDCEDIKLK